MGKFTISWIFGFELYLFASNWLSDNSRFTDSKAVYNKNIIIEGLAT